MAMNHYFQNGAGHGVYRPTQDMFERLYIHAIKTMGVKVYYVPKQYVNIDQIFIEDSLAKFEHAYPIEAYLDNVQGYTGGNSFMSKFGIENNASATFHISKTRWAEEVGRRGTNVLPNRPTEGSLIFFPLTNTIFEIKFVDSNDSFYQLGKLFSYRLEVEVFQYSSERIETGIEELDTNPYLFSLAEEEYAWLDESGNEVLTEDGEIIVLDQYDFDTIDVGSQNKEFSTENELVIDWDSSNPFGEVKP